MYQYGPFTLSFCSWPTLSNTVCEFICCMHAVKDNLLKFFGYTLHSTTGIFKRHMSDEESPIAQGNTDSVPIDPDMTVLSSSRYYHWTLV